MKAKVTKKTNTLKMTSENYEQRKYNILYFLDNLPTREARFIKYRLPVVLGVTRQTLSKWINLPINSNNDIPALQLFKIAEILNQEPKALLNDKIKLKTLQTTSNYQAKNSANITGLTK